MLMKYLYIPPNRNKTSGSEDPISFYRFGLENKQNNGAGLLKTIIVWSKRHHDVGYVGNVHEGIS